MSKMIQITESNNNVHALDEDGNLWVLAKDASEVRYWILLASKDSARIYDPAMFKKPKPAEKEPPKYSIPERQPCPCGLVNCRKHRWTDGYSDLYRQL